MINVVNLINVHAAIVAATLLFLVLHLNVGGGVIARRFVETGSPAPSGCRPHETPVGRAAIALSCMTTGFSRLSKTLAPLFAKPIFVLLAVAAASAVIGLCLGSTLVRRRDGLSEAWIIGVTLSPLFVEALAVGTAVLIVAVAMVLPKLRIRNASLAPHLIAAAFAVGVASVGTAGRFVELLQRQQGAVGVNTPIILPTALLLVSHRSILPQFQGAKALVRSIEFSYRTEAGYVE